ncbi:MAG: helix-turn-helix domain-containing protein [Patescibacteria group bacterium]|jgi:hypothetical protein|nr:helix-turn-helix domain-containing protein [Patescibacteria group bacterium]
MEVDNKQDSQNNSFNPIWLSISEAANIGGVGDKTIRRALKEKDVLIYKIVKDRYRIEFISLLNFLNSNIKLKNKFEKKGLGQYIKEWNK